MRRVLVEWFSLGFAESKQERNNQNEILESIKYWKKYLQGQF